MAATSPAAGAPGPEAGSLEALQQEFKERSRRGVSEAVWTPDGQALVFAYDGHLFRVGADGGEVKRLTREAGGRHALAFSRMEVSCRFCRVVTSICGIRRRESW